MNGAAIATRTLPRMAIPSAIPLDGLLFTSAQGPGPGADADFPKTQVARIGAFSSKQYISRREEPKPGQLVVLHSLFTPHGAVVTVTRARSRWTVWTQPGLEDHLSVWRRKTRGPRAPVELYFTGLVLPLLFGQRGPSAAAGAPDAERRLETPLIAAALHRLGGEDLQAATIGGGPRRHRSLDALLNLLGELLPDEERPGSMMEPAGRDGAACARPAAKATRGSCAWERERARDDDGQANMTAARWDLEACDRASWECATHLLGTFLVRLLANRRLDDKVCSGSKRTRAVVSAIARITRSAAAAGHNRSAR